MAFIKLVLTLFILTIAVSSCKKENPDNNSEPTQDETIDSLTQFEILGKWEIQSRLVNNITVMPALCCEFVKFNPDTNTTDSIGQSTYISFSDSITGSFEVIQADSLIILMDNDTHIRYFSAQGNTLNLRYIEDGDSIDEIWVK